MKKFLEFVQQRFNYIVISAFLLLYFQQCGIRSELTAIKKENKSISQRLDSLATKSQVEMLGEINNLEIAKRVVYDNNTIVRTTQRPDDVMNQYDSQIKELRKKYSELK